MILSYSRLRTFLQCPLRYRFEYVEKAPVEFTSADRIFGWAMHTTLAQYGLGLMTSEPLCEERLSNLFLNTWHDLLKQHDNVRFGKCQAAELEARGIGLLTQFCLEYQPEQMIGIEEPFSTTLKAIPFKGRVDWMEEDELGNPILVSIKTASRRPADCPTALIQPALYALAFRALGWAHTCLIRMVTLVKTQKPQVHIQEFILDEALLAQAQAILQGVNLAMQTEVVYPNPSYLCLYCPYQRRCQSSVQKTKSKEKDLCLSKN